MEDPVLLIHHGREIKLCCKSCKKDFDNELKDHMGKLTQAAARAQAAESHTDHQYEQHHD
jgi:hypothetical protein